MKACIFALLLLSLSSHAREQISTSMQIEKLFTQSTLPDFEPYIGVALPGRCFFKTPQEVQTASVLVPSQLEEGFVIAPLSADKRAASFFDKMSHSEILERFPQVQKLNRIVHYNENEAILYRKKKNQNFEARIRQFQDYFFVRVLMANQEVRYCYYRTLL
ncbi:MAG: hypothetical protein HOP07_13680 [Bacteriovoracaceae bacterium]|nr:hypothetical protein [Bacteriovoracaceae bacterium]